MIAGPIATLINDSFTSGVFPSKLKCAHITPIHKSGDKKLTCNYRPISVLSWVSKIFERVIYTRIVDFANRNTLLSPAQFGFRAGMKTVDAIMKLTEFIYSSLDKKSYCLGVFVDLRKAFDTVNHHVLMQKLYLYGIRDKGVPL